MLNATESDYIFTSIEDFNQTVKVWQCPALKKFGLAYKRVHGHTSLSVCLFGTVANILNLIVLTRRELITPTNLILTGLAFANLLNMVEYIPYVFYQSFYPDPVDGTVRKTYSWALFVLFHANFSQVCHTIAIWLTLTLAIWRYIMLSRPLNCKSFCCMRRAKMAVIMAYALSPILCTPMFFTFSISPISNSKIEKDTEKEFSEKPVEEEFHVTPTKDTIKGLAELKYIVDLSDWARENPALKRVNFWFFSIVIKIVPCVILTIVSYHLIKAILAAQQRKVEILGLTSRPQVSQQEPSGDASTDRLENVSETGSFARSSREMCATTRTTRMLVAVLLLFLITEFPQGFLALLSDLMGEEFFRTCYISLCDLMDFIALLNSAITFILYCTMSQQFRNVFCQVFQLDRFFKDNVR